MELAFISLVLSLRFVPFIVDVSFYSSFSWYSPTTFDGRWKFLIVMFYQHYTYIFPLLCVLSDVSKRDKIRALA